MITVPVFLLIEDGSGNGLRHGAGYKDSSNEVTGR